MKTKKIFGKAFLGLVLFSLLALNPLFQTQANAATFDPLFGIEVDDPTPGAHSNILLKLSQPAGDEIFKKVVFTIPAGWDLASSAEIDFGLKVGAGTLYAVVSGVSYPQGFWVLNSPETQDASGVNHKIHWVVFFADFPGQIDIFGDGNITDGHTFTFEWPAEILSKLSTPLTFFFYVIVGQTSDVILATNPTSGGDYVFQATLTSPTNVVVTRSATLTIPGAVTPTGSDVTSNLGSSVSVTFSSVTGEGITSLTTQPEPPPTGTGQFQLSGGLYYDISTSATFSCPCTVTLSYDPANPNPRIYHLESGVWVDVTTSVDTVNHTVTGVVSSFSFFASAQPNFSWRSPVKALLEIYDSNPMELSRDRTLPLNFEINDNNGNLIELGGVYFQLVRTHDENGQPLSSAESVVNIQTEIVKHKYYTAKLDLHPLNLRDGRYRLRVYTGSTITNAADFILVP